MSFRQCTKSDVGSSSSVVCFANVQERVCEFLQQLHQPKYPNSALVNVKCNSSGAVCSSASLKNRVTSIELFAMAIPVSEARAVHTERQTGPCSQCKQTLKHSQRDILLHALLSSSLGYPDTMHRSVCLTYPLFGLARNHVPLVRDQFAGHSGIILGLNTEKTKIHKPALYRSSTQKGVF